MQAKFKGYLSIMAANIIFGLNIPVTRSLITDWMTPKGYTMTRMLFGTVVFWIIGLFFKKEQISSKDLFTIAIGSFFGFIATQFLFASALQFTTPVYFSLMMSLTPILVLLISVVFLKESANGKKVFGILLSITGAFLIILQSKSASTGSNNLLGIFLAILASFSYGLYLIITRNISIKYTSLMVIKWMFLFSAIMIFPFGVSEIFTQKIYSTQTTIAAIAQLSFALLFSTTLAFFLMPVALKNLKASAASIYMNLQPIVASVVAIIIGQDIFTWDKPLAAVLVIAGVYLVTVN